MKLISKKPETLKCLDSGHTELKQDQNTELTSPRSAIRSCDMSFEYFVQCDSGKAKRGVDAS